MRQLLIKHKSNKTMMMNLQDLKNDLNIDPKIIVAYLGYHLSCKSTYNNGTGYVMGIYGPKQISKGIEAMLSEIIICPECHLPECKLSFHEKFTLDCGACGKVSDIILKNEKFSKFLEKQMSKENVKDDAIDIKKMDVRMNVKRDLNAMRDMGSPLYLSTLIDLNEDEIIWSLPTDPESVRKRAIQENSGFIEIEKKIRKINKKVK